MPMVTRASSAGRAGAEKPRAPEGEDFVSTLSKDALALGAETHLRATNVDTLLQHAGYTFSASDPEPKRLTAINTGAVAKTLYCLSEDVDEIDAFISHSWADKRFIKFLSLIFKHQLEQ